MNELKKNGFTIVELVIVVTIILILSGMAIPFFSNIQTTKNSISLESYEKEIEKGLAQYYIQYGTQISQVDDVGETPVLTDNTGLNTWMQTLNDKYQIVFRAGYNYQYSNRGLFGQVVIKEN